jgi:class 3 adenylate cyclase
MADARHPGRPRPDDASGQNSYASFTAPREGWATALAPPRLLLPPKVADAVVLAVVGSIYAGVIASSVVIHGWTVHLIVATAFSPAVAALWWRRRRPLLVLAIATAGILLTYPMGGAMALVALYTAAPRIGTRMRVAAWALVSVCELAAGSIAQRSLALSQAPLDAAVPAAALALGLYVAARNAYREQLRERALMARALASFLPPEVAELVGASPTALSLQEEVEVTILFSDIRGFSTFAEQVTPRQVAELVGRHIAAMAHVVQAHGGILDKFAGDAVMAVFGAPRPVPGHPARAVRCAIAMQRRQAELNTEALALDMPVSRIGVGVNSGAVIAGTLGGEERLDYTVLGDAVNIAQRLQAEAAADEILISAATLTRCAWPSAEPAGTRALKGRSALVEVYRIPWAGPIEPSSRPGHPLHAEDPG